MLRGARDPDKKNVPNLVLSELELPDKSGLELIKDIRAMRPGR